MNDLERQYVSQFSSDFVAGVLVHVNGVLADADANEVTATLRRADSTVVFSRPTERVATGTYQTRLLSEDTSVVGEYVLRFDYSINGSPTMYEVPVQVGAASPEYDRLDLGFREIIESVYVRFADLFDSPHGGPWLQTLVQSRFGRGRMAQLLRVAIGKLNTVAQPRMTYTLDGAQGGKFPYEQWGPLLEQALYIEVIKHLIRSYTEQPDIVMATNISRAERRDYVARWRDVLVMEQDEFTSQMEVFKMAHMGLGRPRVLVSGGVYGTQGPSRVSPARPRFYQTFY